MYVYMYHIDSYCMMIIAYMSYDNKPLYKIVPSGNLT